MGFKARTTKTTPRPHQRQAIKATLNILRRKPRAQIHMACGTGKTLAGMWIGHNLHSRTFLVMVPSLALIRQSLEEFTLSSAKPWSIVAVCSIGELKNSNVELPSYPLLSNASEIGAFLRKPGPRAVFCTYQSGMKLKGLRFDFGLFDEAHKTAGAEGKHFAFAIHDTNVKIKKRLFMTATPRRCRIGEDLPVKIHDMSVTKIYGDVAYVLSFRRAVELDIICDYRIVVSLEKAPIDKEQVSSTQTIVANTLRKFDLRKAFTYHTTVAQAELFQASAIDIFDKDVQIFHVNGTQEPAVRDLLLHNFAAARTAVMTNARCLTEGVDVPSVDLVVFTQPKTSVIDIVQTVGRAMRKDPRRPRKQLGYVLLPLFIPDDVDIHEAVKKSSFRQIHEVLLAMSDMDEALTATLEVGVHGSSHVCYDVERLDTSRLSKQEIESLRTAIDVRIISKLLGSAGLAKRELLAEAQGGRLKLSLPKQHREWIRRLCSLSGSHYDEKFTDELRQVAPEWILSLAENTDKRHSLVKGELLELAHRQQPPRQGTSLRRFLHKFTLATSDLYDEKFTRALSISAPQWLNRKHSRSSEKKHRLLKLARSGVERSVLTKNQSVFLLHRMSSSSHVFDEQFARQMIEAAPDWFNKHPLRRDAFHEERKRDWLRRAKEQPAEPPLVSGSLNVTLACYLRSTHLRYDKQFSLKIRKLAPLWFDRKSRTLAAMRAEQQSLLSTVRRETPKPLKGTRDYFVFTMSTLQSSPYFDEQFTRQMIELAPNWFGRGSKSFARFSPKS